MLILGFVSSPKDDGEKKMIFTTPFHAVVAMIFFLSPVISKIFAMEIPGVSYHELAFNLGMSVSCAILLVEL